MMEEKARLFDLQITKKMIMSEKHARERKRLGMKVTNFDRLVWLEH